MVLLFGGNGYVGSAFAAELSHRGTEFKSFSRNECDCSHFSAVLRVLERYKPDFVINAAGCTGKPNVDACESHRSETLIGNVLLPQVMSDACTTAGVPWAHVSSGCVYAGAKIMKENGVRVERDLLRPGLREWVEMHPESIQGYKEEDVPNFCFDAPPCSFYSGTKCLGEQVLSRDASVYVWRMRMPFDEFDCLQNYLSKLMRYERVYENINSLTHRGDFARACLDLWEKRVAPGVYNVTNPGFVRTRQVIAYIEKILKPSRSFSFWQSDEEFYTHAALTPRSNCVLDVSKVLDAGAVLRPVEEALQDSLARWCQAGS